MFLICYNFQHFTFSGGRSALKEVDTSKTTYKIALLGKIGVGKTALVQRLTGGGKYSGTLQFSV